MDTIFNNRIHKLRRERAFKSWNKFSYLKKISAERIYERLYEVKRDFDLGLELGSHYGELGHLLNRKNKINRKKEAVCPLYRYMIRKKYKD